VERSRDWIEQARGDLAHARHDLEAGFHDWASFSAQQAAEKALKAVFQRLGGEAWGNSVADLVDALEQRMEAARGHGLRDAGVELDKAYVGARYPNAHPSGAPRERYTRGEAERSVEHAQRILRISDDLLAAL
jgi:HEPN domain-containing protein